jgi:hypothetical protein
MKDKKIRISVDLSETCIKVLRGCATADGRLLKNYVEKVLTDLTKSADKKKTSAI